MKVLEAKDNSFLKLDTLIMYKHDSTNVTLACPDCKLKNVDYTSPKNAMMDIDLDIATKEEFINAVDKASHEDDWYSLLLKEVVLKQLDLL